MIIPKAERLQPEELKEVEDIAKEFDCSILEIHGRNRCVYAILGDENHAVMFKRIAGDRLQIAVQVSDTSSVRVRENMAAKGARKRDPVDLVNESINETLPRTVLTSGTTLAVLTALLVLGGAVIRDFTIVLILGVVIGTYSSIFVASPALIEIQKRWGMGNSDGKKKERPQPATV